MIIGKVGMRIDSNSFGAIMRENFSTKIVKKFSNRSAAARLLCPPISATLPSFFRVLKLLEISQLDVQGEEFYTKGSITRDILTPKHGDQ